VAVYLLSAVVVLDLAIHIVMTLAADVRSNHITFTRVPVGFDDCWIVTKMAFFRLGYAFSRS
jgi:hypothetical protein